MEIKLSERLYKIVLSDLCHRVCFRPLLFIISLIVLIPAMTSPLYAEDENYPRLWTSVSHYTWVSDGPLSPGDISITLNGKPLGPDVAVSKYYDSISHVRMPLEYGASNMIIIKKGGAPLFAADIYYAYSYEAGLVPDGYIYNPFHTEQRENACASCHRMQVTDDDFTPLRPAENICYNCHRRKFSDLTFQHKVAGINWECLKCHQSEAIETRLLPDIPVRFAIKEGRKVAPLCYNCHKDKKKEHSEYEYLHGPVAMSGCNMCHNPHGSNHEKLLQKDISTMCIDCHNLSGILEEPVVHKPLLERGCTECHHPHGSNSPFLLEAGINKTCARCHPRIHDNEHPIVGHPVSGETDPLMTDRPFSCISCHDPHSSENNYLLEEDEIMMVCIKCHPRGN